MLSQITEKKTSLTNHLLVAMPTLNNTFFAKTVILLCEHDENGAFGVILNLVKNTSVSDIKKHMKANKKLTNQKELTTPVIRGGPIKSEKMFVLHCATNGGWKNSLEISDDLMLTFSEDILFAIFNNEEELDINPFMILLGYCEWRPGQLEKELIDNSWLTMPADLDIIFNTPIFDKWRECMYHMGINEIHNLSNYGGHA